MAQQRLFDPGPEDERPLLNEVQFDPGPSMRRGIIAGQQVLNFDHPGYPLEEGGRAERMYRNPGALAPEMSPATLYVHEDSDPHYTYDMWKVGGQRRSDPFGEDVTERWETTPLTTIHPEDELRSGQPHVARWQVNELREIPEQDYFENPWIAEIEGDYGPKRYLLEGHHRATGARMSGSGEFQAHVIKGRNWSDFFHQFDRDRHGDPDEDYSD